MDWTAGVYANRILSTLVGSRARGLSVEKWHVEQGLASKVSDVDIRSIYVLPEAYEWMLEGQAPDELKFEGEDNKGYEVRKFMRGITGKPNPEYLEMLFAPDKSLSLLKPVSRMLVDVRHKFISKAVAKRLVAAAGWVENEAAERAFRTGDFTGLGKHSLFTSALHRMRTDEEDARKKMADVLRRLWVAKEMLQRTGCDAMHVAHEWSEDWESAWFHYNVYSNEPTETPDYHSLSDGYMPVYIDDDTWRTDMMQSRLGINMWSDMVAMRNELYASVMDNLQTSQLRDEVPNVYAQAFLYWVATNRSTLIDVREVSYK